MHGKKFVLQMDHHLLLSIFESKKGIPTHTANKLQHWGTILLNYNYEMEFLPSKKLGHADGLSRLIPNISVPLEDTVIAALKAEKEAKDMLCNTVKELLVTLDEIRWKDENANEVKGKKWKHKKYTSLFNMWWCFTICRSGGNAPGNSKENFEGVSSWAIRNFMDEEIDMKL